LFHYNGHGVPKPTPGGELWVFNKNYTQYIPVSVYDLQTWLGPPCIFVYDCSNAGNILLAFNKFATTRDSEVAKQNNLQVKKDGPNINITDTTPFVNYSPLSQCIQIAACQANEILPMSPDLPADLLTCCLTTPIEIALQWVFIHDPLIKNVTKEMVMKLPGKLNDRRTPLGELNWIFTAITDTIAWNTLKPEMFQRLFRQDLMVAALFRNFLLADRIMRNYNCHPMSSPKLPPTHQHPMWGKFFFKLRCMGFGS
jgi:regulator-associated protein of mTOR